MGSGEAEPETKVKTVTTAEIKVWDQSGKLKEHIKINENGQEEQLE